MNSKLKGKTILITGATGSFGRAFTEFVLSKNLGIKKLIVFSRDELKQFEMKNTLLKNETGKLRFFLGDVRDKDRLYRAFQDVDIIIHAAALKQVPAAEYNPFEFIKTNIMGSQNIIEAALDNKVSNVIALSTDKAVSPINLYGATKLCAEKLFISANNISGKKNIKFSVVRYGNVFGSRGSVFPYFKNLGKDKSFPITHKDMTRFNISLKQSIDLVIWAINNNIGGEILVPKLPSFKITELAKSIDKNKKIKIIGLRPGEKIHEELISELESRNTYDVGKYYSIFNEPPLKIIKMIKQKKLRKILVGSYSSGNNKKFLSNNELKNIIKKYSKDNH